MIRFLRFLILLFFLQQSNSIVFGRDTRDSTGGRASAAEPSLSTERKWRLGVQAGYSYRLAQISNRLSAEQARYAKELKSGFSIGGDVHYFLWSKTAIGAKYSLYRAWNHSDVRGDDITIQFTGLSVLRKLDKLKSKKDSFIAGLSLGYQTYSNDAREGKSNFRLDGSTLGWGVDFVFDHQLSPQYTMSIGASCLLGTVYKLTKESKSGIEQLHLANDKYENLTRVELTIGLRLRK